MTETWLPVPDYPDSYEVSDDGRVRSVDRFLTRRDGTDHFRKGRILRPGRSGAPGKQYLFVGLGGGKTRSVHRLVLEGFVGPCPDGMEACHNNGDRFDNRLENLRWDTASNNNRDKVRHGTQPRKTHCKQGHEFTPDNTYVNPANGGRVCRSCRRTAQRQAMRDKLSTAEGRADRAAYVREWRKRTGRVDGLGNHWARRTLCKNGHEFTPENTVPREGGGRRCRTCLAARRAEGNRRTIERRRSDPAKRAAWNAYMREYRKRKQTD